MMHEVDVEEGEKDGGSESNQDGSLSRLKVNKERESHARHVISNLVKDCVSVTSRRNAISKEVIGIVSLSVSALASTGISIR